MPGGPILVGIAVLCVLFALMFLAMWLGLRHEASNLRQAGEHLLSEKVALESANNQLNESLTVELKRVDALQRDASSLHRRFEELTVDLEQRTSQVNHLTDALQLARENYATLRQRAQAKLQQASERLSAIKAQYERVAHWEPAQSATERIRELEEKQARAKQILDALRNAVDGYGARYVVPPNSLLDDLAREAAHTEPGQRLKEARATSRAMVKNGAAARSDYTQDGRGELAANFALDAFNGKVESILADVKSDNIGTLVQRLKDAYLLVNTQGRAFGNSRITQQYLDARLEELRWAALVQRIQKDRREEQRRIKERMREEVKAQREFEKAAREAKKREDEALRERESLAAAREQAIRDEREKQETRLREELQRLSESQREEFETEYRSRMEQALSAAMVQFEGQLAEADERIKELEATRERAKSMAQQTKRGTVYVISNIGSFGEGVFKIGQTRRPDPEDRIWELSDASVPFDFDVHAFIETDDAPKLEGVLHERFVLYQVNKMNWRKEYFRVPLLEIRRVLESMGLDAKTGWTMEAAAQEFRETQALELQLNADAEYRDRWVAEQLGHNFGDAELERVAEEDQDSAE